MVSSFRVILSKILKTAAQYNELFVYNFAVKRKAIRAK